MSEKNEQIIITLLMRLYDINMAMLNLQSPETADKVYEAHDMGVHFNPKLFIYGDEQ